jgi:CHASE3 domain sensor protein
MLNSLLSASRQSVGRKHVHRKSPYLAAIVTLMVMLLCVVAAGAEHRGARRQHLRTRTAQSRKADLATYLRLIVDAESGQRGYSLTQDPTYLTLYEASRQQATELLPRITKNYLSADSDAVRSEIRDDLKNSRS